MDQIQTFLRKLYRGVGTTRAKRLENLLARGEWARIQSERMSNPSYYHSPEAYLRDALVVEITRKLMLPSDSKARSEATQKRWLAGEQACALTNARLNKYIGNQGPFESSDLFVIPFITAWRKNIQRVLGRAPYLLDIHFSSGATLSDKGKRTTIPDKLSSTPTVYPGSIELWRDTARFTCYENRPFKVVSANRYFEVPKDSSVNRACCVEASASLSMQLSVGKLLKRLYRKRYKVDLRYAKPLHREAAKAGSLLGHLVTIDLSNASDTIARKLVELVLPRDWYALLNSLRAQSTEINGKKFFLEKFSSMGNGFTFELETILFRTLMETCGADDESCLVFGDDIVVSKDISSLCLNALRFFGFTPNENKTFCEGPFRESCGGDYFLGVPVRAHYLKQLPDEPQHWLSLANGLRRADPHQKYTRAAWRYAIDQLPTSWRLYGPSRLGDIVIHDEQTEPTIGVFRHRNHNGSVEVNYLPCYTAMVPVTKTFELIKHFPSDIAIQALLKGAGMHVSPRDAISGYRRVKVLAWGHADPAGALAMLDEKVSQPDC